MGSLVQTDLKTGKTESSGSSANAGGASASASAAESKTTDKLLSRTCTEVYPVHHIEEEDDQTAKKNIVLTPGKWHKFDPFLLMAEDWFSKPGGFPDHPHRGFETVTLVLEGGVEHGDNKGNKGVLLAGDVQWMTAGRGIVHSEMPYKDTTCHSLQLWLNLPRASKMTEPRYQDLAKDKIPVYKSDDGVTARVISGEIKGVKAPTKNHVETLFTQLSLPEKTSFTVELPASNNCFVYVLSGEGKFGSEQKPIKQGFVGLFAPLVGPALVPVPANSSKAAALTSEDAAKKSALSIANSGSGALQLILCAADPLREPVAAAGPFVMNTQDDLYRAFRDYQSGKF